MKIKINKFHMNSGLHVENLGRDMKRKLKNKL